MKIPVVIITIGFALLVSVFSGAQNTSYFKSDNGQIKFISDAPLELIQAESNNVVGILNPANGELAFGVKIETFEGFNNPLQKVHFNENYMESGKYPRATFSGKLIESIPFDQQGLYEVRAKGILNIHGVEQERIIKGTVIIDAAGIKISTNFNVPLEDHEITIPKIVNQKIASLINVSLQAELAQSESE